MGDSKLGIGSKIEHPKFGLGIICNLDDMYYRIYFSSLDELKSIDKSFDGFEVVDKIVQDVPPLDLEDIEKSLEKVMLKYATNSSPVALHNKWLGGTLEIKAGNSDLQSKEIPIKTFYNKIISVREKLRVLEQNINNHDKLDETDKLHLQQYISRAYGSLTTFNVLFADKSQHFKGMGKS